MIRSASLLAAALVTGLAAPASAQGVYDPNLPPPLPQAGAAGTTWEDEAEGEWEAEDAYRDDSGWREDRAEDREEYAPPHRMAPPGPYADPHHPGARMGYSPDQRADWLERCRAAYYDADGRRRGQVIGGLLGAAAGGAAGYAIADDERLAGTLIGAGVGGLAGMAVGGEIGEQRDRARFDECEDYLLRYERSYAGYGQGGYGYGGYGYAHGPVIWVKVPIVRSRRGCGCERVIEERIVEETIVEEVVVETPRPEKRVRIVRPAPVPTKTVRSTK